MTIAFEQQRSSQEHNQPPAPSQRLSSRGRSRLIWLLVALTIFTLLLVAVWRQVIDLLDRPIAQVQIEGVTQHLDRGQLAQMLVNEVRDSTLFSLDVRALRSFTKEHPWVRSADVTVRWPAHLIVSVEEEVPVARWGRTGLLNQQGDIFLPAMNPVYQQLPLLNGPAHMTAQVMARYHAWNPLFRQIGLNIVALSLEERGAWELTLDNGIRVVIGRQAESERLDRFLKIYPAKLAAKAAEIEQVDIRYSNGIAVRWRPVVANDEKQINDGNGQ